MKLDNFYLEDGTLLEFTDSVARENISKHTQLIANIDAAIQAYTKETTSSIEAILTTIKDKADTKSLNNYLPLTGGTLTGVLYTEASTPYFIGKNKKVGMRAVDENNTVVGQFFVSDTSKEQYNGYYSGFVAQGNDGKNYAIRISANGPVYRYNSEDHLLALKEEIPSIDGLATELYVQNAVSDKATTSYVDTKVADLVNSAPETLDTLGEVAKAIQDNESVVDALNNAIGSKADKSELNNYLPLTAGSDKVITGDLHIDTTKGLRLGSKAQIYANDADYRLTICPGEGNTLTIRPNPNNSTGMMHLYNNILRPGSKEGVQLGHSSYPFAALYATNIYQNGKQVANKEDIPTNITLSKINEGIEVIDNGLTYSRGMVEVRKIGDILWIIDSGVYNFTDNFTTKNNRTVLQFTLPKELSNRLCNTNGVFGTTGTIGYFPALAYENITYTTFNCQSYVKRSSLGEEYDTFQLVYTGLNSITGGGLCGFHSKMPLILSNNTN